MKRHRFLEFFKNLRLKYKLFLTYSIAFIFILGLSSTLFYFSLESIITNYVEEQLNIRNKSILKMVKTTANVAIKNYLRGVTEKNYEILHKIYMQIELGQITEENAKKQAIDLLLSQKIGTTGYIYCIDTNAIIKVHPRTELLNTSVKNFQFVREQIRLKEGYIEYFWSNPGEKIKRPKALYMKYFEPWDWIISVSSYREEFNNLINVKDIKGDILALNSDKSGYSFIIDSKGNLIIHPVLEGQNVLNTVDIDGFYFIREMIKKKTGTTIYSWKNPNETSPRKKIVIYNYIPEFDWIVASSSFYDEIYKPLTYLNYLIIFMIAFALTALFFLGMKISSFLIKPINQLISVFAQGASGNLSVRSNYFSSDEIGSLHNFFNIFMEQLDENNRVIINSEKKYREIFEGAIEGIYQSTLSGKFISANIALAKILGFDNVADLINSVKNISNELYVVPSQRAIFVFNLVKKEIVTDFEIQMYKKDKSITWLSLQAKLIKDENNEPYIIEGFATDITKRKIVEETLVKSEEALRSLYQNTLVGVIRTNPSGEILMANPAAIEMIGFSVFEEFQRHKMSDFYANNFERDILLEQLEINGQLKNFEFDLKRTDGSIFTALVNLKKIINNDVVFYEGILEDITYRKEYENKLKEAKDQAEKSNKLKTEFLAQMSHEIRTPINTILSYASLIEESVYDIVEEDVKSSFNSMDSAGRRIIRTIDLILNMSELQTGIYEVNNKEFNFMKTILQPLINEFEKTAIHNNISLILLNHWDKENIFADEYSTFQIFENLLSNAFKYTNEGFVEIELTKNSENQLIVNISDSGIGISDLYLNNLFQPFSQEEQGYTRKYEGNGLGLALVKKYCDLNNFEISVKSIKKQGSKFTINLNQK